ncbi:hypothetical protein SCc_550 [Serratia symbiotica str. 'Cinara cedri']|nr:hypothetical protein SCc_550 [Serratia symbiotica str. 'Cinara cedri']
MDRYSRSNSSIIEYVNGGVRVYMAHVYGWMTCGLLLTAFVSWYTTKNPTIFNFIFSNPIIFFSLIIMEVSLVLVLSSIIDRLSAALATSLFMLYSALTGLTLSSIFITQAYSSIASAFITNAGMFGAMSFYGYTTRRNLSSLSNILLMAIIGIVIASLVNIWLKSSAIMWLITYIGVAVFVVITAYDTNKLKSIGDQLSSNDNDSLRKHVIIGALTLYLDFINLFLMLLRIFSNRR